VSAILTAVPSGMLRPLPGIFVYLLTEDLLLAKWRFAVARLGLFAEEFLFILPTLMGEML